MRTPIKAYRSQKHDAKQRGIRWRFTFQDWVAWWETNLGPDWNQKRGCVGGKYVMARKGDKGPYSPTNTKCILHTANIQERNSAKKITREVARAIFNSIEIQTILAERYDVHQTTISNIKKRHIWRKHTLDL